MKSAFKIGLFDIIVAVVVVSILLLSMLPISRAIVILPVLLAAYILPCIVYRRMSCYGAIGQLSLSMAFVMMAIFFILNLKQSTVDLGSADAPFLLHDAYSFYRLAQDMAHDTVSVHSPIVPYWGYPYFLSMWMKLGINDIAFPIITNIFALLIAVLLVGRCVVFVVGNTTYTVRMAGYAMMLTAMVPGVMATATQLSKEPFVIVSLLLCINAMYAIKQRHRVGVYVAFLIIGLFLLSICRPTYLYVLLIFVLAIWLHKFKKADILPFVLLLLSVITALHVGLQNSWWGDAQFVGAYVVKEGHTSFSYGESQKPFLQLIGEYNEYSNIAKVLILPVTVGVQFMIPFPFETVPEIFGMPLSNAYHRMSYLWYLAALPMLLFFILHLLRTGGVVLNLMAFASAVAYCVPALITGGVVSRYAFCFVPLLSVAGAYVLAQFATYDKKKRFITYIFSVVYLLLISIALYIGAHPSLIL